MQKMNAETLWEDKFQQYLNNQRANDAAHDIAHVQRVVANARRLAGAEQANLDVVMPAAWLHDCVIVPKNSPQRSQASRLAAKAAGEFLREANYPAECIPAIEHAIAAHSFSAKIPAETLEAKIVQDADRLDAIGAIGIARAIMVGTAMRGDLYNPADPFPTDRTLNDKSYTVDHFYTKLFKLEAMMQTQAGHQEAQRRTVFMRQFLFQLGTEIGIPFD